jgi:uncharacterized protein YacL
MNTTEPFHPAEQCLQQVLQRTEDYVRREPVTAMVAAIGAGLLLKLLPARAVARPLASLAMAILPSALLGLGVMKALELCSQHCHDTLPPGHVDSP